LCNWAMDSSLTSIGEIYHDLSSFQLESVQLSALKCPAFNFK
jgi:hypothetical protein